ncbi:MAG: hypothetical protein Q8O84_02375 [Nanoarchaeota archaeon]|nr:hypothetical protein [Nanoarchaeota archaeon]
MAKKSVKKSRKKSVAVKKKTIPVKQITSKYNSRLALRDLILFALLSIISFILFTVSGNTLYQDTFYLLAMLFGFVALAFLIVFLVIIFARGKVKKSAK